MIPSRGALRLLKLLRHGFGPRPFPKQSTLSQKLGCALRTINRYTAELKAAGMIEVHQRGPSSSYYTLIRQSVTEENGVATKSTASVQKPEENLWNELQNGVAFGVALPSPLFTELFEFEKETGSLKEAAAAPWSQTLKKPPAPEHTQPTALMNSS